MHVVNLPALDGRDPLGFLAALGLVALLSEEHDACLAFAPQTMTAALHSSRLSSPEAIADALARIIGRTEPDQLIPGVTGFPLPSSGTKDPHRVPRDDVPALAAHIQAIGGEPAVSWFLRVVNQFAADAKGHGALTPFMAPRGRQTVRTFFAGPLKAVMDRPESLLEALISWQRVPGCTGENLDHRAAVTAAESPDGLAHSRGVPGATWLATQALVLTHLGADWLPPPIVGSRAQRLREAAEISDVEGDWDGGRAVPNATMWHRHPNGKVMLWPLWSEPLDLPSVKAIISFGFGRVSNEDVIVMGETPYGLGEAPETYPPDPAALSIFYAAAARRDRASQYDAGPLSPLNLPIRQRGKAPLAVPR
ncbi:hypothetical protein OG339_48750 (plasmid) [Streptosporangium sp. NBC_01495]|uniref:type I-G CRISPR-associated protein, Cas3-extension family n=1 Tax=Streptosporangium sp. NBC_01495 TaxID=2903899 RepID=UPI002E36EE0C|nr:hypothetical protein [Streptosporangium sp. NBC_01495]